MPPLPPAFTRLVAERPLPLDDIEAQPLQELPVTGLRVIAARAVDLLGAGVGTLLVELGVARAAIATPLVAADLATAPGYEELIGGQRVIEHGASDRALVVPVQRALQAVAARVPGAPMQLALPGWGADGIFGNEGRNAVTALQRWRRLAETGRVGVDEARELHSLLEGAPAPSLFDAGHPVELMGAAARRVVEVAEGLCAATREAPFVIRVDGVRYQYFAEQFGVAATGGLLRVPGGVAYDIGRTDYWKCNIFGGTVLSLAEVPVHTFQAGRYRHFPRAEQFGPALARKRGWKLVAHLDHRDPEDAEEPLVGPDQDDEIRDLLDLVRPGDMLFVDHPGPPGEDGGHTRVCTRAAEHDDEDHAPLFAQARLDRAEQERNGLAELAGGCELQFWLVRLV